APTGASSGPGGGSDDDDDDDDSTVATTGTTDPSTGSGSGVCLLHNCDADEQCDGCSEGRVFCTVDERRCVAGGEGGAWPPGQACSSWGTCVPEGRTCPTDAGGTPQIGCQNSGDCAADSPAHRVCEPACNSCVACTEFNTAECQSTDICRD